MLLCQIEACLNSRPLYPLSNDPRDLTALTPGHLLIGEPPINVPEPSRASDPPGHIMSRWALITNLRDNFWNRWSTEYLHHLQQLTKWRRPCQSPRRSISPHQGRASAASKVGSGSHYGATSRSGWIGSRSTAQDSDIQPDATSRQALSVAHLHGPARGSIASRPLPLLGHRLGPLKASGRSTAPRRRPERRAAPLPMTLNLERGP